MTTRKMVTTNSLFTFLDDISSMSHMHDCAYSFRNVARESEEVKYYVVLTSSMSSLFVSFAI